MGTVPIHTFPDSSAPVRASTALVFL